MAVLPIMISGEPVLHQPAARVVDFDATLRTLVSDMLETMDAAPGVGLAGPQVGVPLRVFVFGWEDDDGVAHRGVAVNPELWITPPDPGDPAEESESEGCLSFPGERFPLRRSSQALLRAQDEHGAAFEVHATGWLARIFQHEFDHLGGILYTDRLVYPYAKAAAKAARKNGWIGPGNSWQPGIDHPEG